MGECSNYAQPPKAMQLLHCASLKGALKNTSDCCTDLAGQQSQDIEPRLEQDPQKTFPDSLTPGHGRLESSLGYAAPTSA